MTIAHPQDSIAPQVLTTLLGWLTSATPCCHIRIADGEFNAILGPHDTIWAKPSTKLCLPSQRPNANIWSLP